jgi:tryptophan synthase alpha chain
MSAVDTLFEQLRREGRKAFMPFVTAGDPDLDFTAEVITELVGRGSHLCEVGVPYSDPIADGPVIQASYTRALSAGVRVEQILQRLGQLELPRPAPLVTMVCYAIVYRYGIQRYLREAKAAGLAGAIVPDLPVEESEAMAAACREADFSLIQLVTPTTSRQRALKIAETSTGFLYYVSVTGITGERTELPNDLLENVGWMRQQTDLPICIGFGISRPEHVKMLAPVADGLIVGSAIMRQVAQASHEPRQAVLTQIGDYATQLLEAFSD